MNKYVDLSCIISHLVFGISAGFNATSFLYKRLFFKLNQLDIFLMVLNHLLLSPGGVTDLQIDSNFSTVKANRTKNVS